MKKENFKPLVSSVIGVCFTLSLLGGCGSSSSSYSPQLMTNNGYMQMSAVKPPTSDVEKSVAKTVSQDGKQTLFIQPQAGAAPIINAVKAAKTNIDIQIYMLTMKELIPELIEASKRNVQVRLIMEKAPFNPVDPTNGLPTNLITYKKLKDPATNKLYKNIYIKWSNKCEFGTECSPIAFGFTHQKSMLIDSKVAYIMSMNLSGTAVANNREYLVADTSPAIVSEVKKVFESDWNGQAYVAPQTNLVVSPVNSRKHLETLITNAKKTLLMGFEVWGDDSILNLLAQKQKAGVEIKILMGHYKKVSCNLEFAQKLKAVGITNIKFLGVPFLHGKVLISDNSAYIGSINTTTNSMEKNREMGIVMTDTKLVNALKLSFNQDFSANSDPMPADSPAARALATFVDPVDMDTTTEE